MPEPSQSGKAFHGEFFSADASAPGNETAARYTLYDSKGVAISTLGASQQAVITDLEVVNGAAVVLTITIYDGSNVSPSNGNYISQADWPANGGRAGSLGTPHYCVPGTFPKLKSSAGGQVRSVIHGIILG